MARKPGSFRNACWEKPIHERWPMRLPTRQFSTASVGTTKARQSTVALAVFEESFGPVHYEVAATLHNLAAVLVTKRNYQEAEENYRRALSIKERLLGADSPDVALTCSNLGSLLTVLGRRSESVPLLKSAIAILENRLTPAHPELALARENLRKALS